MNTQYVKTTWDNTIPSKEIFDEIFRVSKNQIIFGGNYFTEFLHNTPCWIIWDKTGDMTPNNFADCELAWTSFKTPVKKILHKSKGFVRDEIELRLHPTQKPRNVMGWILENYSKEGELVLDPFAGSCTTAIACKELNRNYICIEKESEYINICHERLDKATQNLF